MPRSTDHRRCAVGEIGLDYHYDFAPRDVQQEIFRAQIRSRRRTRSCRSSSTPVRQRPTRFAFSRKRVPPRRFPLLYRRSWRWRGRRSIWVSICRLPGIVTFPKAQELRDVARRDARWTGCSAKRTPRTWRRFRTAASGTSRRHVGARRRDAGGSARVCRATRWRRGIRAQLRRSLRLIRLSATA